MKTMMKAIMTASVAMAASATMAHTGHEHTASFMTGFSHPLGGLDHLLAMVAVGLWAASLGGRALWVVPAAFVGTMLLGGALGMTGIAVPYIEQGISLSVIIFGALVLAAKRLPLLACMTIAGGFALFHGAAHGLEMPSDASGAKYAVGFALATALLHSAGVVVGQWMARLQSPLVARITGAIIALSGMALAVA